MGSKRSFIQPSCYQRLIACALALILLAGCTSQPEPKHRVATAPNIPKMCQERMHEIEKEHPYGHWERITFIFCTEYCYTFPTASGDEMFSHLMWTFYDKGKGSMDEPQELKHSAHAELIEALRQDSAFIKYEKL